MVVKSTNAIHLQGISTTCLSVTVEKVCYIFSRLRIINSSVKNHAAIRPN